jgi:hypothetical protein
MSNYFGVAYGDNDTIDLLVHNERVLSGSGVVGYVINGAWKGTFTEESVHCHFTGHTMPSRIVWVGRTERCPWRRKFPFPFALPIERVIVGCKPPTRKRDMTRIKKTEILGCQAFLVDGCILQVDSPVLAARFKGVDFLAGYHVEADADSVTVMPEGRHTINLKSAIACLLSGIYDDYIAGVKISRAEQELLTCALA